MSAHEAYRSAVAAAEEARQRYEALANANICPEPIAETVEERIAQYAACRAEKDKNLPELMAAFVAQSRALGARDAAFAALKGN